MDEASGAWRHWASCVPEWTYPYADANPKFAQLVIPTLDSVRCAAAAAAVCAQHRSLPARCCSLARAHKLLHTTGMSGC